MKRIIAPVIIAALLLSLCSCKLVWPGKSEENNSVYDYADILDSKINVRFEPKDYRLEGNVFYGTFSPSKYTVSALDSAEALAQAKAKVDSVKQPDERFEFEAGGYESSAVVYIPEGGENFAGYCVIDFGGQYAGKGLYGVFFEGDSGSPEKNMIMDFGRVIDSVKVN